MRRLARHALNALTALSLLLCGWAVGLLLQMPSYHLRGARVPCWTLAITAALLPVARLTAAVLNHPKPDGLCACVLLYIRSDRERVARQHAERCRREGVCISCGYSLTGNVSGVCPECGTKAGER